MRALLRLVLPAVITAVLTAPTTLSAQPSAPIVGSWNLEWEIGRSRADGGATAVIATGTMSIVADGDSLVATLTTSSRSDGAPITRPTATFGGRRIDGGATFTQVSESMLTMNGEARVQRSISLWTITVSGDQLTGQLKRSIEGLMIEIPSVPVKGWRTR
jgi:hypothetical protein